MKKRPKVSLIIVDRNCSAVCQCLLTRVRKNACMGIVYLSFTLVPEPRQSHEETPKGTEGLLHNHLYTSLYYIPSCTMHTWYNICLLENDLMYVPQFRAKGGNGHWLQN